MIRISIPTLFALAFALASPAGAGDHCQSADFVVGHIFEKADEDGDGLLSADEYAAAGLERYGVSFEDSDLNDDGVTSLDEYRELHDRHHPAPVDADDMV